MGVSVIADDEAGDTGTNDALILGLAGLRAYGQSGDWLAAILGYALAAMESGEPFEEARLDAARNAILSWHQLRNVVG